MRAFVLAAALLVLAAPAVDASCHFCSEQVQESCAGEGANTSDCAAAVGYMATHYPQHILNGDD